MPQTDIASWGESDHRGDGLHALMQAIAGTAAVTIASRPARNPGPRSIATTERILASAEALLRKHGEKFTLGDVAAAGRVSMASIYSRYPSKVHLIQEVQLRVLRGLREQISEGLLQIASEGGGLEWRATRIVEIYAESHMARASIIRAFHAVAREDSSLRVRGVETVQALVEAAATALLGPDIAAIAEPAMARLQMIAQTLLHALASYLGFGYSAGSDGEGNWLAFKDMLARMVYLSAREIFETLADQD